MAASNTPALRPDVLALREQLVAWRRHFHQHPELSFAEHKTAAYIVDVLRSLPHVTDIREGVGRTGVTALVRGEAGAGPTIALRADMDALPIQEQTSLPFASQTPDVMHACGHDGHMAILLTAASIIASDAFRKRLRGTVKFLFQPAEEGLGGAREMIKDKCLEGVDEVYGLHLWNYDAPGTVLLKKGTLMASSDSFTIEVLGKGGHGAVPQGTRDAIVAASALVLQLHTIVSRNIDPLESAVLTVGTFNGGFNHNVICDKVTLTGTVRTHSADTQALIRTRMQELCDGLSTSYACEAKLDYEVGYPCTVNDPKSVEKVRASALKITDAVQETRGTMASEDMSYYLEQKPGCFFFVGSAPNADGEPEVPHHKSVFTVHEDALPVGASVLVQIIEDLLF